MNCPYCGRIMKKGTLPNETHPYWVAEGESASKVRGMVPRNGVKLALEEKTLFYKKALAYYCDACKKVIASTM
ncbi:MAG: PF20097 family protein [Lachnospiraceae bacterium]|nr:PF20097 family protein [Lachnospiraceae bacterium]